MINMNVNKDDLAKTLIPVGAVKSFGPFGPMYQVVQPIRQLDDGDWLLDIIVVESGEKVEYRLSKALADPVAE